jgi:hypothetical protein
MDLNKLNLEQKKELLQVLQKKDLLAKEKVLERFVPHTGQLDYLFSQKRITAVFSGNGWGKTTMLVIRLILAHHPELWDSFKPLFPKGFKPQEHPVGQGWFLISGFDKVEDYWNEIKRWCPPSKLPTPSKMGTSAIKRLEWNNGTVTTFYSFDQDSQKLEGSNIDALFLDECCPRALWIAAYRGLRNNKNYFIIIAGTPISEPWLYEEIYQPWANGTDPNILVLQGSTYQNPHLSKEWIEDFQSRLTEEEVKTRIHGEFQHLQGRVFKEFSRQTHVIKNQDWPTEWPVYCAIDPHPRKPHTVLYAGVTDTDVLVVLDEIEIEGTVQELAEAMRRLETKNGYKVVCRRIDNSGAGTDWNRNSVISELDHWSRDNSYNVRVSPMRKSEKDVAASIQKIKLLLKNKELVFMARVPKTLTDMELYAWQDHRNPETSGIKEAPRKIHDDFIDPLRYLVMSNPIHSPTMEVISTFGDKAPYSKTVRSKPEPWGLY